jgi:hypothetical protein
MTVAAGGGGAMVSEEDNMWQTQSHLNNVSEVPDCIKLL